MKLKEGFVWVSVGVGLAVWLQMVYAYHFYYIEQSQLFLLTGDYFREHMSWVGGMAEWMGEGLVQFFIKPYAGALIVAALLVAIGCLVRLLIKQSTGNGRLWGLALFPMVSLLFPHYDFNYQLGGTVAYLLMLLSLIGTRRISSDYIRRIVGCLSIPLFFYLFGPVAHLYSLMFALTEGVHSGMKGWLYGLGYVIESLLVALIALYATQVIDMWRAFTPAFYYHPKLFPPVTLYLGWVLLPIVFGCSLLLRSWSPKRKVVEYLTEGFLLVLALGYFYQGFQQYGDVKTLRLKELDYYARTEQWDKTIEACKGKLTNYLYMAHLNVALANQGELGDRLFEFDQRGVQGLFPEWNKSENLSCLQSDLYYALGMTAASQEMAFEGYLCAPREGQSRMLKRLVETNLIMGFYDVAEKYIARLEHTLFYRDWAKEHRRFLWNDAAVEADAALGMRRRLLPKGDSMAMMHLDKEVDAMVSQDAEAAQTAVVYLAAQDLLAKDLTRFRSLIERYAGTPALPYLPRYFQEALFVLAEQEPGYEQNYEIPEEMKQRFAAYKQQVLLARNNLAAARGLLTRSFGDTYWFYVMFK